MYKDWWYNKVNEASKDEEGNEANITHDDSYGFETTTFTIVVSDEGANSKTWFLGLSFSDNIINHRSWLIKFDE